LGGVVRLRQRAGSRRPVTTGIPFMHTRFFALLGLATLLSAVAPVYAQDAAQAPPAQAAPGTEARPPAPAADTPSQSPAAPVPGSPTEAPTSGTAETRQPGAGPATPAATPSQPAPAAGQPAATPGQQPARLPPPGSPPLVRFIQLQFPAQGGVSVIDPQTYLFYIQTQPSRSSEGVWVPYKEETVLEDFKRLWATNFLDNLSIEVKDAPYDNGVVGKHVIYSLEERQRVKIVDYTGSKKVDQSKIDEKLKEENISIRLDSFIDPGLIRKVEGVVRGLLSEKGHQFAEVTHEIKPMPGGPKLVHLTFVMNEGPKVRIREIDFVGNKAVSDGALRRQMKANKQQWLFSFITGRGTFQEAKFEEDAEKVTEYYRNRGYVAARVGAPELKYLQDSSDGKTRYVQLRIQVQEGGRYKVGNFTFDGNKVVKGEALRPLFNVKEGEFYSEKRIRKGLESAREVYGAGGYWEFTGFPDLKPRDLVDPNAPPEEKPQGPVKTADGSPIVDVTMRMQEGEQYFVNRVSFVGNTTTRDNVVRREIRLLEGGIFNTEALKYSVKRINQLGYFKNLEGNDAIKVEKTPGEKNKVDVTLTVEEQNRNQVTFGAGVSQFEGFFGQLAFQTSNFLGRGESATFSVLAGRRAKNYQVAFTEPFLFDRPITAGIDLFKRELRYIYAYTQASSGGNAVFGFPVADFSRMFLNYSLQKVSVKDVNPLYLDPAVIGRNPFLQDALLQGEGGSRTISQVTPSFVHNTIDNPIFPTQGRRYTASIDVAGLGGNVSYLKPRLEGVWMFQQSRRTSFGFRGQVEYIKPYGGTTVLPIFEKLFLGGEYSVRGYDIRSIGPRDIGTPQAPGTFIVIGGDKSLLFNVEYLITIAGPVRLVLFYDAGQVRDEGQSYTWKEFKTSTGAEIRFFMPVLNVPFRLIFAANPQRDGVLDNNLFPAKKYTFKFAVGSTF
jgi:outer membrane protein insertion porin family